MLRKILWQIDRFLVWLLIRLEVSGMENVPPSGSCLLVTNHLGAVEPALLFVSLTRQDITGLVADKNRKNAFLAFILQGAGAIWLNRERADKGAMQAALEHLQKGGLLGIAPEGTRSRTGALGRGKTGAAYLAAKVDAPLVPVAFIGTQGAVPKAFKFQHPRIQIVVGEPFRLPPIDAENRAESLRRNTDEIMCRIAALLPESYRGVYADHPRLVELLNSANPAAA